MVRRLIRYVETLHYEEVHFAASRVDNNLKDTD